MLDARGCIRKTKFHILIIRITHHLYSRTKFNSAEREGMYIDFIKMSYTNSNSIKIKFYLMFYIKIQTLIRHNITLQPLVNVDYMHYLLTNKIK